MTAAEYEASAPGAGEDDTPTESEVAAMHHGTHTQGGGDKGEKPAEGGQHSPEDGVAPPKEEQKPEKGGDDKQGADKQQGEDTTATHSDTGVLPCASSLHFLDCGHISDLCNVVYMYHVIPWAHCRAKRCSHVFTPVKVEQRLVR